MLFRFRYEVLGGHTHVKLFAGPGTFTLACCGNLVFRNDEWADFKKVIDKGQLTGGPIEFVQEGEPCA